MKDGRHQEEDAGHEGGEGQRHGQGRRVRAGLHWYILIWKLKYCDLQASKDAKVRAGKAEEEVEELVKKSQQLEVELDKTLEELLTTTEKLKEKENSLSSAELEVNVLNRRVQGLEGDLETCEDKLLLATQKLDKVLDLCSTLLSTLLRTLLYLVMRESSLNYIEYIFGKSSLKDIR